MTAAQEKVISIAKSQIGYLEKASYSKLDDMTANAGSANYTKYGEWYGLNGQPWCAIFVSWCFYKAGLSDIAPKYAGCYAGISWFRNHGAFHGKDGYTPQPGDVIFFSSAAYPSGGAHTGIVTDCKDGVVYTVEGNTSGGTTLIANGGEVAAKSYTLTYSNIYGYGTPLWQEVADELTKEEVAKLIETAKKETLANVTKLIESAKAETLESVKSLLIGADTTASAWAVDEIEDAKNLSISDGTRPQGYAKREEVIAMVLRGYDAATFYGLDDGR